MMKARSRNILLALALAVLTLASCNRGPRVIPRSTMVRIYSDMLLEDQWLMNNRDIYFASDTMLVYEPVFNKYGYTTKDYRESVKYYLQDPDRFSRLLKKTSSYLDEKRRELERELNGGEDLEPENRESTRKSKDKSRPSNR